MSTIVNDATSVSSCLETLYRIIYSPQVGGNDAFFRAAVVPNVNSNLLQGLWNDIVGNEGQLTENWTDLVMAKLRLLNPYCSFAIRWKWVKRMNSRKCSRTLFRTSGYCTFSDCSCTFQLTISDDLEVGVTFTGVIKHSKNETKARPIRKRRRELLKNALKYESPSTLRAKMFLSLTNSELVSGNRNCTGNTVSVFQKISSEGNKEQESDPNLVTSILLLKDDLVKKDTLSTIHKGYIQRFIAFPFGVVLFTELGLRLYHNLASDSTLQCDATGTIVQCKELGTTFYYAITVRHPKNRTVVALAELISTEQSVLAVSHFLQSFRSSYVWLR